MTDKEIIIDGVDVSKCEEINSDVLNPSCYHLNSLCKENPNCYYKQLQKEKFENLNNRQMVESAENLIYENSELYKYIKEKEQECEELNKCYSELIDMVSPYMDDFTGYNEELGGFDIVLCVKELMEQLDQLKAENEELKKNNKILCDLYKNVDSCLQKRTEKFDYYLKALDEIRNIIISESVSIRPKLYDFEQDNQILDIINKAKGE